MMMVSPKENESIIKHMKVLNNDILQIDSYIKTLFKNNETLEAEYICSTQDLINEYKELVKTPIKISFLKKREDNDKMEKNKKDIFDRYIELVKLFIQIPICKEEIEHKLKCECGNNKEFRKNDTSIICEMCGKEFETHIIQTSFKDTDRINMSQKYKYKRKVHFRDAINQYQGKQNKKIPQSIFDTIDDEFKKHSLLIETEDDMYKRHKNITKDHIYIFLNETGNNSYYEDINFIHRYFTGIACPDISDVETDLLNDFDKIVDVYDTLPNIDRVNFLNCQCVLYQLLRKRGKKVKESDFSILKSRERLIEHDLIYGQIAEILQFNH